MRKQSFIKALVTAGLAVFMMAASASAATITFNTNDPSTSFGSGGLFINSTFGAAATLTFVPVGNTSPTTPASISYGDFILTCGACSTQAIGAGAFFGAFTVNLTLTDVTDGAVGQYVGTSAGGAVWSDATNLVVNWAPLSLGPGAANAAAGNFGTTTFTMASSTIILAPTIGNPPGDSPVLGTVDSGSAVPEPATLSLIGGGLLGLGLLRRRRA